MTTKKQRLAAELAAADKRVAAFLNGGADMSSAELAAAHRALAAAREAGVTRADLR